MINLIPHSKPYLRDEESKALSDVIKSFNIEDSNWTTKFGNLIKNYLGLKNLTFTSSGSHALSAILEILEIKEGDEVILPTYVCESILIELLNKKAVPVFCEIDGWVSNEKLISEKISSKTKAIIIVHLFGIECSFEKLKKYKIPIIEDCCQSFGLKINHKFSGAIGDFSFFSFHPTKCLTTGEGGAFSINNEKFENNYSFNNRFIFKMSNLNSSLGYYQLLDYDSFLKKREKIAQSYLRILFKHNIKYNYKNSIWFRFPLIVSDDKFFIEFFKQRGITIRKGVDNLLHKKFNYDERLILSEHIFNHTVSIPIYPALSHEENNLICSTLDEYIVKYGL